MTRSLLAHRRIRTLFLAVAALTACAAADGRASRGRALAARLDLPAIPTPPAAPASPVALETPSPPPAWSSASLLNEVLEPPPVEDVPGLARWAAHAEPGPVADFAPVAAVATHHHLEDLSADLPRLLTRLLGARHVVERYAPLEILDASDEAEIRGGDEDTTLLWMRDYQPLFVRRPDGSLKVVRYLSVNPNRTRYEPSRPAPGGRGERSRWYPLPGDPAKGRWLPTETLPLVHENGNLVSTGRYVFVTERIFEDNVREAEEPHLVAYGYRPRTPIEILELLASALERPVSDIIVLPAMPGEATGHVDLFVMALGPRSVLVPEIRGEAIDLLPAEEDRAIAADVADFLDVQTEYVRTLGITVRRLPMLPPVLMPSVDEGEEQLDMVLYSPANGLLAHLGDRAYAILPTYDGADRPPAWGRLARRYHREWAAFFRARGWTPRLVDATELGRYLGLFRCVTASIPR